MAEGTHPTSASATTAPSSGFPARPPISQLVSILALSGYNLNELRAHLAPGMVFRTQVLIVQLTTRQAGDDAQDALTSSPGVKHEPSLSDDEKILASPVPATPLAGPNPQPAPVVSTTPLAVAPVTELSPHARPAVAETKGDVDNVISAMSSLQLGQGTFFPLDTCGLLTLPAGPSVPQPAPPRTLCANCQAALTSGGYDPNAEEIFILPADPPSNDRWHAVTKGTRIGIFQGWYVLFSHPHMLVPHLRDYISRGVASPYVTGISNAAHKGYKTKSEAINAYRQALATGGVALIPS